jgi:hypothetical protein
MKSFYAVEKHIRRSCRMMSYDTTFNFGEFHVSVLLMRGICFSENPKKRPRLGDCDIVAAPDASDESEVEMTAACSDTEHRFENCNITCRNSSIDKTDDARNAVADEHLPTPDNVNDVANDVGYLRNLAALDHATADAKRRSWDALSKFAIGHCSILERTLLRSTTK